MFHMISRTQPKAVLAPLRGSRCAAENRTAPSCSLFVGDDSALATSSYIGSGTGLMAGDGTSLATSSYAMHEVRDTGAFLCSCGEDGTERA